MASQDSQFTGAAWGYFILNATLAQLCADSMMLAIAAIVPALWSFQGDTVGIIGRLIPAIVLRTLVEKTQKALHHILLTMLSQKQYKSMAVTTIWHCSMQKHDLNPP